ncbi:MAG: PAS domain-containing protein [Planctomycetota bacterium]|nr:MAG: PAS domain-containing protein [Planctomycetota bacterium]
MNRGSMPNEEEFVKIKWLLFLRPMICLFCLALLLIYELGGGMTVPAYVILGLLLLLNLIYLNLLPYIQNYFTFLLSQAIVDSVAFLLLIYFTGGVLSIFSFLCFVGILHWNISISPRSSVYFASCCTIFLSLITISHFFPNYYLPFFYYEWIGDFPLKKNRILASFFAQSVGFYLIVLLAGRLSKTYQRARIFYDEIVENIKEGLIVLDSGGNIVLFNKEAKRLLSPTLPSQAVVGNKFEKVFERKEYAPLRQILSSSKEMDVDLTLPLSPQAPLYLNVKTSILKENQHYRGVVALLHDLTLKKQLKALEQKALHLEGIEEMAMGIAHEIRNPLASLRGCVQELFSGSQASASLEYSQKLQEVILSESDRLDRILQEFLEFARPSRLHFQYHNLPKILEEVFLLLENHPQTSPIRYKILASPTLPKLECDRDKIFQVFFNLALNSLEAKATRILISVEKASNLPIQLHPTHKFFSQTPSLFIKFQDNGEGFSENTLKHLFTPFFTTKSKGSGLGLSTVYKIVKLHRGHIEAHSSPSQGATFCIWLPCHQMASTPEIN